MTTLNAVRFVLFVVQGYQEDKRERERCLLDSGTNHTLKLQLPLAQFKGSRVKVNIRTHTVGCDMLTHTFCGGPLTVQAGTIS